MPSHASLSVAEIKRLLERELRCPMCGGSVPSFEHWRCISRRAFEAARVDREQAEAGHQ